MEPDSPEPSMEDILASIKRIIADDGDASRDLPAKPRRQPISFADVPEEPDPSVGVAAASTEAGQPAEEVAATGEPDEDVLELTRPVHPPEPVSPPARVAQVEAPATRLVSDDAAVASRQALAALSALLVTPPQGADNTLEGLVREMLRPMLKEWLDARLPDIVEQLVAAEISRITARGA